MAASGMTVSGAAEGRSHTAAPLEELTIGGLHDYLMTEILPRYEIRRGRAVDLGAGSGALAVRLRAFGFAVLAVDANTERFRADVAFQRLDLNQLDFASALGEGRFDFVAAVEVIEHLENPIGFLRNVCRLLKPDGVAVITTPNVDSAPARVKFLLRGKLRFLGDACNDTHLSPIFWDLLTRQYLPRAELRLAGHYVHPPNSYKVNLPRSAWAFRILARLLSGPALLGDSHVFVLKRRNTARQAEPMETQRATDRRAGVIVVHPGGGQMRSYEAAVGLQQAGLLQKYIAGFYFQPESAWGRILQAFLDGGGTRCGRKLRGRFHPELPPERVLSFPTADLIHLTLVQILGLDNLATRTVYWRNKWFCTKVDRALGRVRPAAVVCYDSCALEAFRRAKSLGLCCVLDQCIAHIKTGLRLLREEAELHPEFADSLPLDVPDWWVERCCKELELADAVLISSVYGKQTLVANGVSERKIFVIPYATEVGRFQPRAPRPGEPFRVLFVGRITQRKGIKYLLEAFRQLALPKAELVLVGGIAGSGKGLEAYRGLFTHIPSVPYPELHSYFQLGSIFVLPGLHESGVLAIHEALASGLPVIATPNCGSVVRDGIEGFIVPIRDVEALKEKILLLYENKELREEMSRRARLRAEEFTWAAYRQRLNRVLLDLLASRG